MGVTLAGMKMKPALAYLDDLIVFSRLANLRELLVTAKLYGLQFTVSKCFFGFPRLRYLGHMVRKRAQNQICPRLKPK
jgi:hypothetical protein